MTIRDSRLVDLRPALGISTEALGSLEVFQTQTLRPILKLQNPVLLSLMSVYLKKFCPRFSRLSRDEKKTWVRDVLKRDSRPKNMLIGMVAGHFTEEEFAFFIEQEPEIRRRLIDLCIQRIQDQIDMVCPEAPSA